MRIDIDTRANTSQAEAKYKALTAQVAAFNAELARSSMIPAGGSPDGFKAASRGARYAAHAYDAALASSGAFRVEQLRINDTVAKHTELLQKQKLTFREVFGRKNRNLMRSMYHEQLAMQQSFMRTTSGNISTGRQQMSLAVPTTVEKSWDSLNNRIGWFNNRLASASMSMVNWGKNVQWAGRQLSAGLTMPMVAFGAAAAVMTYKLDEQLTRIAKVYDTTANQNAHNAEEQAAAEAELKKVREDGIQTAKDAAYAFGSAATDTLSVQAELAATGLRGLELQKSTTQVMRIATLGELDHAVATKA